MSYEPFSNVCVCVVDDRLPCTPMGTAAFAASSDMCESWIMLLEKGIAKYLGSYGHIGHFSNFKADSTLMALRWFTGGHVSTLPTCEFGWKSVEGEGVWEYNSLSSVMHHFVLLFCIQLVI